MFKYNTTIKLHDTDASGRLYFSNQFRIFDNAFASFLESINLSYAALITDSNFLLPIVHAESDYKIGLKVSDEITVNMSVENIGTASFTLSFQLFNIKGEVAGFGRVVHVSIDKNTNSKIPIPGKVLEALEKLE
jgi:1,4-dihydroxy-2-naphthoyl-CoA hydrolase